MKYTFEHNGKQKTVTIEDEWLLKTKSSLKLSTKEAIELWMFDHDYVGNEEADALTEKAKASGAGVRAKGSTKRKAPTRKPDETKRALIAYLKECVEGAEDIDIDNVEVTNIERVIAFSIGDDKYELTLSKKRKPKA